MLRVKCTLKIRNSKNNIIAYKIVDEHNRINTVKPEELKQAIKNNIVECTNLTLTKDGRLVDKRDKAKYYRYTIWFNNSCIGGLFRGINRVLDNINEYAEDGSSIAIDDYEDINRIEGQLEYILKFPNIKNNKAIFYFEEDMRNRIIDRINQMNTMMKDYGYIIKEEIIEEPHKSKVIYRDQDQIAIIK